MTTSNKSNLIVIAMIFFSTLCSTSFLQVAGDDALVKKMCGATSSPDPCTTCTKKSGHDMATDIDVIEAVLLCADADVNKLLTDTQKISADGSTDIKVKNALNSCIVYFQTILDNGDKIRQQTAARKFDAALSSIQGLVFQKFGMCRSFLSGITVPQPVDSGISNVEADYRIAIQLLTNDKAYVKSL